MRCLYSAHTLLSLLTILFSIATASCSDQFVFSDDSERFYLFEQQVNVEDAVKGKLTNRRSKRYMGQWISCNPDIHEPTSLN
jgi:hypothetical protein